MQTCYQLKLVLVLHTCMKAYKCYTQSQQIDKTLKVMNKIHKITRNYFLFPEKKMEILLNALTS